MLWANEQLLEVSNWTGVDQNILIVLAWIYVLLVTGSLLRLFRYLVLQSDGAAESARSLRTWWIIVTLLVAAVAAGGHAVTVLLAVTSLLALHEYVQLVKPRVSRSTMMVAYLTAPVQYLCIASARNDLALMATPACAVIAIVIAMMRRGHTKRHIAAVGSLVLGMMISIYLLSFTAMLLLTPQTPSTPAMGYVVFVVFLTMASDILQAMGGRAVGGPKITPVVSPRKTWAGLVTGVIGGAALAMLAGPELTRMTPVVSGAIAVVLVMAGFFGDISMSAIKRHRGARHSGTWLPGQGGILDRIDSLSFTAPLFYLLIHLLPEGMI